VATTQDDAKKMAALLDRLLVTTQDMFIFHALLGPTAQTARAFMARIPAYAGRKPSERRILFTVVAETATPSPFSSPKMRW
jgi:hypothetical protein